ncbi:MAG: glycoside hydrolase family 30 beta sandwich domain-containing protein, partial [Polymorphobacter sp.]
QADVTAWQQYGIATQVAADGKLRPGWLIVARDAGAGAPALALSDSARALAQVFVPVVQGSVRIAAHSNSDAFKPVAFMTPAKGVVLVFHSRSGGPLTITGLPPGRYRLSDDSAAGAARLVTVNGALRLTANPAATTTLAAQ